MSKLSAVIRHEFTTVIKQPSFWVMLIATPLFIGGIMAIVAIGEKSTASRLDEVAEKLKNVAVVDDSGYILPEVVESSGQKVGQPSQLDELREDVRDGDLTGLVYYPNDLKDTKKYQIYVNGNDFTTISALGSFSGQLLNTSIFAPIGSADVVALATGKTQTDITTFENGIETAGFNRYIVPGVIATFFFLILFFAVGYALTSIAEEKENRSMEMLLTHVRPRDAIVGKLVGVILITLFQLAFFAVTALVGYWIALKLGMQSIQLPAGVSLDNLVFDPVTIMFGIGFLIAGFALYAGLLATTAVMLPYKQANAWSSIFYIGGFSPFWFLSMVMTDPENPVVRFVTFFPLTSPTTALLRNMFGSLTGIEAVLALVVMAIFAVLAIGLAIRLFPRGALEFENPLSLRAIFGK